jgi:16S rRNA (cytidine1402-2'-O)-methyltransferase
MTKTPKGILYLVPNFLDPENSRKDIPEQVVELLSSLNHFIAESEKSLRAFIKKLTPGKSQSDLKIGILNEHTQQKEYAELIKPLLEGNDIGLISDAGMPCIADPGYQVVRLCHQKNIRVVPLSGPSSILLLLVSSGFNGQQFTFHGYLPYEKPERIKKIKQLEKEARNTGYTQLFIETPYRNNQLLKELTENCLPDTLLCIGSELTAPGENIMMMPVAAWRKTETDLNKKPAIFALGR